MANLGDVRIVNMTGTPVIVNDLGYVTIPGGTGTGYITATQMYGVEELILSSDLYSYISAGTLKVEDYFKSGNTAYTIDNNNPNDIKSLGYAVWFNNQTGGLEIDALDGKLVVGEFLREINNLTPIGGDILIYNPTAGWVNSTASLLPFGSLTGATLRWDGTNWIENDNILSDGDTSSSLYVSGGAITSTASSNFDAYSITGGVNITAADGNYSTWSSTVTTIANGVSPWSDGIADILLTKQANRGIGQMTAQGTQVDGYASVNVAGGVTGGSGRVELQASMTGASTIGKIQLYNTGAITNFSFSVGDLHTGAAAATGMIRFNSSTLEFEGYDGTTWLTFGDAQINPGSITGSSIRWNGSSWDESNNILTDGVTSATLYVTGGNILTNSSNVNITASSDVIFNANGMQFYASTGGLYNESARDIEFYATRDATFWGYRKVLLAAATGPITSPSESMAIYGSTSVAITGGNTISLYASGAIMTSGGSISIAGTTSANLTAGTDLSLYGNTGISATANSGNLTLYAGTNINTNSDAVNVTASVGGSFTTMVVDQTGASFSNTVKVGSLNTGAAAATGMVRFDNTTNLHEGYDGTAWRVLRDSRSWTYNAGISGIIVTPSYLNTFDSSPSNIAPYVNPEASFLKYFWMYKPNAAGSVTCAVYKNGVVVSGTNVTLNTGSSGATAIDVGISFAKGDLISFRADSVTGTVTNLNVGSQFSTLNY